MMLGEASSMFCILTSNFRLMLSKASSIKECCYACQSFDNVDMDKYARFYQIQDIHCCQLLIGHLTLFTLVQKVKIGHKKLCFYKQNKALPRLCKLFHSKMTCTVCIDDVRVKVPSFQKVTQFLQYKIFHIDIIRLNFCLFEVIPDCHDLRRINFKSFASIGIFISST